jgi:hypothetical protein
MPAQAAKSVILRCPRETRTSKDERLTLRGSRSESSAALRADLGSHLSVTIGSHPPGPRPVAAMSVQTRILYLGLQSPYMVKEQN